MLMCTTLIFLN